MKIKLAFLGIAGLALTACGGGGGEGEFIVSDGVLDGIELPTSGDLAEFPQEVQDLIAEFQNRNENTPPASNIPTMGTANYAGTFGISVENGDEILAVITGDLALTADWDNPFGDLVTGNVTNLSGEDGDGNALHPTGNLAIDAPIAGASLEFGTVMGTITLPDGDYGLNGSFDGAFAGDGATSMIGQTEGTITNPDNSTDSFSGLWYAD